jgi:hypothetical protein
MTARMAYCGDVCDYCPRYIATQSGNRDKLNEVAILWHKAGSSSTMLTPEEMICHGCSPAKVCPFGIAKCASEKRLNHCGECFDYPCPILKARFDLIPKLSETLKNVCTKEQYDLVRKAFFPQGDVMFHEGFKANNDDRGDAKCY